VEQLHNTVTTNFSSYSTHPDNINYNENTQTLNLIYSIQI